MSTQASTETKAHRKTRRSPKDGPRVSGGSAEARKRAAAILEVLGGVLRPSQAASALGVGLPRYYMLERRALEGLVQGCEPPVPGRRRDAGEKEARLAPAAGGAAGAGCGPVPGPGPGGPADGGIGQGERGAIRQAQAQAHGACAHCGTGLEEGGRREASGVRNADNGLKDGEKGAAGVMLAPAATSFEPCSGARVASPRCPILRAGWDVYRHGRGRGLSSLHQL